MKKITFLILLVVLTVHSTKLQAQKKYEKIFYKESIQEGQQVSIAIVDGVSTDAYIKFKMRVKNNTSDYILVRVEDIVFKTGGKEYKNMEKDLLVGPNDEDYRVIDIKGADLRIEQFSLEMKGFSKVPVNSGTVKTENFKLPIIKNDFDAGGFKVTQLKSTKKTDEVSVKFSVQYTGTQIGIVHPGKATLLTSKGTEFANMASRGQRKPFLLKKGENSNFILIWNNIPISNGDTQFTDLEILWHDCFKEAISESFSLGDMEVLIDKTLTDAKN